MRDRFAVILLSLCGLALMLAYLWTLQDWWRSGENDFPAFYAGARLVGSGELYDIEALRAAETEFMGTYARTHGYVRPPFHAALLWPLGQLPYMTAFAVYSIVLALCFAFFVAKWPMPDFWARLPFCMFAAPVFLCFAFGQDAPVLLAVLAAATILHRDGRPVAAGVVLSLAAIKPHLFVLAPIWVLARRDWSFLKGGLAGGAALAAVSVAVEGWDWPVRMLQSAFNPAFSPNPHLMPNLTALLLDAPAAEAWYALGAALLAGTCWYVSAGERFEVGLAAVLLGGVLLARHSYLADCALWLPAALTLLCRSRTAVMRFASMGLLIPITYLLGSPDRPTAVAATLALLLVFGMAAERWRLGPRPVQDPQPSPAGA